MLLRVLTDNLIRPALAQGTGYCDRFTDSTLAYQGLWSRLALHEIEQLKTLVQQGLSPIALSYWKRLYRLAWPERAVEAKPWIEKRSLGVFERVERGFQTLAALAPLLTHQCRVAFCRKCKSPAQLRLL